VPPGLARGEVFEGGACYLTAADTTDSYLYRQVHPSGVPTNLFLLQDQLCARMISETLLSLI